MIESIGCPVTIRPPRHGAVSENIKAMLRPKTAARPIRSDDVRRLLRSPSAPAQTLYGVSKSKLTE